MGRSAALALKWLHERDNGGLVALIPDVVAIRMGDFERDTAVEGEVGCFRARLSRDWEIWGPNGGYVAAIALRAAGAATPLRRPASFTGHFLSVAEFDEIDISVVPLREAKRAASLRVSMRQNDRAFFEAIVWVVDDASKGLEHDHTEMPAVPLPEDLSPIEELMSTDDMAQRYRFWNNLDAKPIDFAPWAEREPGTPCWREWYRFRPRASCEDPFADAARSLLLIDTMLWPAAHRAHPRDVPYVAPSLDVTAQFHRLAPASEWLLVDAVAPVATGGLIGAHARIWSERGALVASGTGQLLCRPVR